MTTAWWIQNMMVLLTMYTGIEVWSFSGIIFKGAY